MKSNVLFSLIGMVVLLSPAFGDDAPMKAFTYRVEVPSAQVPCAQQAQQIADAFGRATGDQVTGSFCQSTRVVVERDSKFEVDAVVISYLAQAPANPFHAIFSGADVMGTPYPNSGLFKTYADCLSQVVTQEAFFSGETGLAAVDAHCDLSTDTIAEGYSLVIDGFGTPKSFLGVYAPEVTDLLGSSQTSRLMSAAKLAIIASGGHIAYSDELHVFFYSQNTIPVVNFDLGLFADPSQCTDQLDAAKAILIGQNLAGISVYCDPVSDQAGSQVNLVGVGGGTNQVDAVQVPGNYSSYSDCMNDKARVLANEASNNEVIVGAICSPADANASTIQFVMNVYRKMDI